MASTPEAVTPYEGTAEMLRAYETFLPKIMQSSGAVLPEYALQEAKAAAGAAPVTTKANVDLYKEFAPELAQVGTDIEKQTASARVANDTALMDQAKTTLLPGVIEANKVVDPEYYKTRELASNKLADLLNSIDVNSLSGSERAEVERSLAQQNSNAGRLANPSALSTVSNAMTFGNALQKKRDSLSSALASAAQLSPTLRSGTDAYQLATGKSSQPNNALTQFTGVTDNKATDFVSSIFGGINNAGTTYMNNRGPEKSWMDSMNAYSNLVGSIL